MTTYAPYAWIITDTHRGTNRNGWIGPDDASKMLLRRVEGHAGEGYVFHMYDPAGDLLYTGRMILAAGVAMTDDENRAAPYIDFGIVNGVDRIDWDGHPEWNEHR